MATLKAGIYVRISDDSKSEVKGLGVGRQEADCREFADRRGMEVVAIWTDNDFSAYSGKRRPAYETAVAAIAAHQVDALVIWNQDRLNRSPRELEDLVDLVERTGCEIHAVTAGEIDLSTPEGRLTARITGAVARKESEDKSRRISRKLQELRDTGKPAGRLGFPYDKGGVINPGRLKVMNEAAERILAGESCGAIAADFNGRGIPSRWDGKWTYSAVRNMLTSPSLVSLVVHKGEIVGVGNWPAAMDRATWDRIGAALVETPRTPNGQYLLSGLARCSLCGGVLTGAIIYGRTGRVTSYRCRPTHVGGCGGVSISQAHIERVVLDAVKKVLGGPMVDMGEQADELASQIASAEQRLVEYAALLDAGELELVEWKTLRAGAAERIKALRARQGAQTAPLGIVAAEAWGEMSLHRQRQIVAALVEITVRPSKGGSTFDTSRVQLRWLQ